MYRINRNNYRTQPKKTTIYTPSQVSQFIFELLQDKISKEKIILDPCCGQGSLLRPWNQFDYETLGVDNDTSLRYGENRALFDFLSVSRHSLASKYDPTLILCNPPWNGYAPKLGSEVWLDKIIELFGSEVPIVLFVPMGFRLNSKKTGRRWSKFINHSYPPISSIISLPRDIFPTVEFHSEILIFNVKNLQPHYFFSNSEQSEQ